MSRKKGYIDITDEMIQDILFHKKRTGVGPQKLLRGKRGSVPVGLSSSTVYNWIRKVSKSAKREHLDYVLGLWKTLPDNPNPTGRYRNYRDELEPISPPHLRRLKKIQTYTGILPGRIFKHSDQVPKYLNANIVGQWLTVDGYKARPEDVAWVLKACDDLLMKALSEK